jgi:hypothetical protein
MSKARGYRDMDGTLIDSEGSIDLVARHDGGSGRSNYASSFFPPSGIMIPSFPGGSASTPERWRGSHTLKKSYTAISAPNMAVAAARV